MKALILSVFLLKSPLVSVKYLNNCKVNVNNNINKQCFKVKGMFAGVI